jgi:hypothetical protein
MQGMTMSRTLFCLIVTLLAGAGASQAAAPPVPERVRFLSVTEAAALALEKKAGELGVRRVMAPEGSDFRKPPWRRIFLCGGKAEPTPEQQRKMNQLLLNVEVAYWNLYGSI